MSAILATDLDDLFAGSFIALTPAASDVDRPRLLRRLRNAARSKHPAADPLVEHLRREGFRESKLIAYTHQPFDTRWLYLDPSVDREYIEHVEAANEFVGVAAGDLLVTRRAAAEHRPMKLYPLYSVGKQWLSDHRRYETTRTPNLSSEGREFVRRNGVSESDLFHHVVAMLAANGGSSLPLPDKADAVRSSAALGYRVATLFAADDSLAVLTQHDVALRGFAVPARTGKEARMLRGSALVVSELWESGEDVRSRPFADDELSSVHDAALDAGISVDEALSILGNETYDVHLNERALIRNVPVSAWRYAYRGAPLLRSWLSDRHAGALGRPLLRDEVTQISLAARRITELLLLGPALRKNCLESGGDAAARAG